MTLTEKRMTMPRTSHHVDVLKPTMHAMLLLKHLACCQKQQLVLSAVLVHQAAWITVHFEGSARYSR